MHEREWYVTDSRHTSATPGDGPDADAKQHPGRLIIDRLPEHSTLILVGRSHARASSIARQRLDPGIVDVTVDDLAFDLAETEGMLNSLGLRPDST